MKKIFFMLLLLPCWCWGQRIILSPGETLVFPMDFRNAFFDTSIFYIHNDTFKYKPKHTVLFGEAGIIEDTIPKEDTIYINWNDSIAYTSLVYSPGWGGNEIEMIDGKVSIKGDTILLIKSLLIELKTANDKLKANEFTIESLPTIPRATHPEPSKPKRKNR